MAEPYIGEIKMWACNFAPRGWAYCDGQLLPISQNTALFSILGTTYGGDGRTTLGVPNLKDRAPMHYGSGPGLTPRRLGQFDGQDEVTLATTQIAEHNHLVNTDKADGDHEEPEDRYLAKASYHTNTTENLINIHSAAIATTGGGQSHENQQPFQVVGFCVALVGQYPSRS